MLSREDDLEELTLPEMIIAFGTIVVAFVMLLLILAGLLNS